MDLYTFWITLHVIGAAIGVGSVTTTDIYIFRALVSESEFPLSERILLPFRLLVIISLSLLVISGVGLFLLNPGDYIESEKFRAKMLIVLILLANGLVMLKLLTPGLLTTIQMTQRGLPQQQKKFCRLLKKTVPVIVVSTVSWYAALVLGAVGGQSWSVLHITGGYIGVIAAGTLIGLLVSRRLLPKSPEYEVSSEFWIDSEAPPELADIINERPR